MILPVPSLSAPSAGSAVSARPPIPAGGRLPVSAEKGGLHLGVEALSAVPAVGAILTGLPVPAGSPHGGEAQGRGEIGLAAEKEDHAGGSPFLPPLPGSPFVSPGWSGPDQPAMPGSIFSRSIGAGWTRSL